MKSSARVTRGSAKCASKAPRSERASVVGKKPSLTRKCVLCDDSSLLGAPPSASLALPSSAFAGGAAFARFAAARTQLSGRRSRRALRHAPAQTHAGGAARCIPHSQHTARERNSQGRGLRYRAVPDDGDDARASWPLGALW